MYKNLYFDDVNHTDFEHHNVFLFENVLLHQ